MRQTPFPSTKLPYLCATLFSVAMIFACTTSPPVSAGASSSGPRSAPEPAQTHREAPSREGQSRQGMLPSARSIETTAHLSVDFARPLPEQTSMVGFNFFRQGSRFRNEDLAPIKPGLFRSNGALFNNRNLYATKESLGFQYLFEVSAWGLPNTYTGRDKKRPYLDFDSYRSYLKQVAKATRGKDIIYDIWNEPNNRPGPNNLFWFGGSEKQFFETFKIAHDTLRQELGDDIKIAGPSDSRFDAKRFERFMNFARSNRLKVDVLAWHELHFRSLPQMARDIQEMRRRYIDSPDYASVGVEQILIPEIVGGSHGLRPAANLAYLYYLEKGGADGAARACWKAESHGDSTCINNSLNGLLTHKTRQKRALWWTYKVYADGLESRVESSSNNESVVVFASKSSDEPDVPQIVVGLYGHELFGLVKQAKRKGKTAELKRNRSKMQALVMQKTFKFDIAGLSSVAALQGKSQLTAEIYRLPFDGQEGAKNRGEASVGSPIKLDTRVVEVKDGSIDFEIPEARLHEVYVVKLRAK